MLVFSVILPSPFDPCLKIGNFNIFLVVSRAVRGHIYKERNIINLENGNAIWI